MKSAAFPFLAMVLTGIYELKAMQKQIARLSNDFLEMSGYLKQVNCEPVSF